MISGGGGRWCKTNYDYELHDHLDLSPECLAWNYFKLSFQFHAHPPLGRVKYGGWDGKGLGEGGGS